MNRNAFFDDAWQVLTSRQPPFHRNESTSLDLERTVEYSGRITAHTRPLIDAISDGNAVVYVGAGASKAAGLPDWREFLHTLAEESRAYSADAAGSIDHRITDGDYLIAAEMLQNLFGPQLQNFTHREFSKVSIPTPIHRAISAIPFSLAITTNYDCLLEGAYHIKLTPLTWQNPGDVLQNLRSGIFCVLKLHGDYAIRDSVVLTRSHYRDLLYVNHALLNSLRMLLATRTFLFVGVSCSDPDLLALLDEAKSLYGHIFGPHYAIFPQKYYDPEFSLVLERSYNIRTLVAKPQKLPGHPCDEITGGVAALLSHLGGIAANSARSVPYRHGIARYFDDPSKSYRPAGERIQTGWLLRNLVHRLGVPHGNISMCDPQKPEHRVIYRTFEYTVTDDSVHFTPASKLPEAPQSIQNRLFLQRKIEDDFILLPDISTCTEALSRQGFHGAEYRPQYKNATAALCIPIYVDGRRSGVITLEADAGFSFSKYHYEVASHYSSQIGMVRYESNRVFDSTVNLKRCSDNPSTFQEQLRRSRDLDDLDLQCLLYLIDPYDGKLIAKLRKPDEIQRNGDSEHFVYKFEDKALACEAFRERRTIRISDASEELEKHECVISRRGIDCLKIDGPVCAFPVHVKGYTAGVFVAWSGENASHSIPLASAAGRRYESKLKMNFWRGMERARRLLHVIANEPTGVRLGAGETSLSLAEDGRAAQFLNSVRDALNPIDRGESWGERVGDARFRRRVIDGLLKTLVSEGCGLRRARLFRIYNESNADIRTFCIGSCDAPKVSPPGHHRVNGYRGIEISKADNFIESTIARSEFDPYARLQDEVTLGGIKDPSVSLFHKVPGRPWIVAPVGRQHYKSSNGVWEGMTILGYLAGDDFRWNAKQNAMEDASTQLSDELTMREEFLFKRYCLDFISDVLSILIEYETNYK